MKETGKLKYRTSLNITIGYPASIQSSAFFNEYNSFIGGLKNEIKTKIVTGASLKIYFFDKTRFGISADYLLSTLYDSYTYYPKQYNGKQKQETSQMIDLSNIPVIFSFEYLPIKSPYKTYVGFGFGFNISQIKWNEIIVSTIVDDPRVGGVQYDERKISPAFVINTGVELDFDRYNEDNIIHGIILEFKYTHIWQSLDIFKNIATQYSEPPDSWQDDFSVFPGYLSLNFGLSININALQGKL